MIKSDILNGTIVISDTFDLASGTASIKETPKFDKIGDEYILSFTNLENINCFTKFFYDTLGLTSNRYLNNFYRISMDGIAFSSWMDLNKNIDNFPQWDPKTPLFLDIKWVRAGNSEIGTIRILEYSLKGEIERSVVDDGSIVQLAPGQSSILKAPYIYKVFSLSDMEILSDSDLSNTVIKYRYSQDNSRTWTKWEPLTTSNISTTRINPIRFFQIEYNIENKGTTNVSIQDINLHGDFQNVSKDYFKSNLFGIRDTCQSNVLGAGYYDANGNLIPVTNPAGSSNGNISAGLSGDNCQTDSNGSTLPKMSAENKAGLYNPYQQNAAMGLLTKLSNDAQQMFGHKVIYFATDPDKKGEDHTLNEYQLYNVACEGEVKVSVEGNNFPDSQIVMNQFDLNLFSTMEVHITKQQFKEVFGPQRRPAKEDFLYFCNLNRMYSVDHAQQFRNFNNSAVYYKLILKKYNSSANFAMPDSDIRDKIKELTKNSTIDELFGLEQSEDKRSIANKDQLKPLTRDPIRLSYKASIDKELIENSSTIISKSNYDLSSITFGDVAVEYNNIDPWIKDSDNIGYMIWFNIHNYVIDDVYNLFTYYDETNLLGWKVNLKNDAIVVTTNELEYTFDLKNIPTNDTIALDEEVWYCYVLNIDQRQRELSQYIYKRDCNDESQAASLGSTKLRKVYNNTQEFVTFEALMETDNCLLRASDMKATNLRLFADVLPVESHNKLLNQTIIGNDANYLIFADNANSRISLPRFPLFE